MQTSWIKTINSVKTEDNLEDVHRTTNEETKHFEHGKACHSCRLVCFVNLECITK